MFKRLGLFFKEHQKQIGVTIATCSGYSFLCYKSYFSENELLRFAVAGSIANLTIVSLFHFVDTVNIRSKSTMKPIPTGSLIRNIYKAEGMFGFGRGFSAAFYGAAL